MSSYSNELSNISYTNKDFNQIYTELLDLAKKISYKWDPSVSDESDPGVVLLKMAALMADKCNYNIDKNVLELFPVSVTQLANARQLYDQCGYTMRYFNSATTKLLFKMTSEPELTESDVLEMRSDLSSENGHNVNEIKLDVNGYYLRHYKVPKFTMFSDVDSTVVYTVLEDVLIPSNGESVSADAIQGTIRTYSVNGTYVITADMLDSRNRIYLTEINVPENGIFITNKNEESYWDQCDNLSVQPLGSKCYKFGLTLDGNRCYIEFPSDARTLIGSGLSIKYLLTSGILGNVKKKFIRKFFAESEVTRTIGTIGKSQTVELTDENVYIHNMYPSKDGKNPESIDEAYKNYQKIKTTFETLVSKEDYSDFLVLNNDLSNCIVCDRSNDIQSSYNVLTHIDGEPQLIPHVRDNEDTQHYIKNGKGEYIEVKEPEMTPFDLRIYGLKYVDGFYDYADFSKSFEVPDSRVYSSIEPSTSDIKCLSHNYKEFIPSRIIMLKNRYPIYAKIVSPYKLALSQQEEILNIVKLKLFQTLNSQKIEFGQEIDYNLVYNTILKADPRISGVILEDIQYETYAVYLSEHTNAIEHIRIDSKSSPPTSESEAETQYLQELWNNFRSDVYASAILNGKTPLFLKDGMFMYSLAHEHASNGPSTFDVVKMSSKVDISMRSDGYGNIATRVLNPNEVLTVTSPNLVMDKRYANYCQFVTNIGCKDTAGKNIRKEFKSTELPVVIEMNSEYALAQDEYIIFFWRTTEDPTERYKYVKYTGRNRDGDNPVIISPSYNFVQQPNTANINGYSYNIDDSYFLELGDPDALRGVYCDGKQMEVTADLMYSNSNPSGAEQKSLNYIVENYFIGDKFNLKSNSIEVKTVNKIHLNDSEKGTNKFYWILNNVVEGVYRLFSDRSDDVEYTLKDGEMLLYSNDRLTQLYVLGAGTKINREPFQKRNVIWGNWDCPKLDNKLEFLSSPDGPAYFEDPAHPWFNMKTRAVGMNLYATEMIYKKLGAQTQLILTPPEGSIISPDTVYKISVDEASGNGVILREDGTKDPEFHLLDCSLTIRNEFGEDEKLPDRKCPAIAWKISPSLNINMSYDSPQRIYEDQTIKWHTSMDTKYASGSITGSNTSEIYIQSDTPLAFSGGPNIDVRLYDILTNKYKPVKIYIYRMKEIDMSIDYETNHYDAVWNFSDDEIEVSGNHVSMPNISLPEGNYVLPVEIKNFKKCGDDCDLEIITSWIQHRKLKSSKELSKNEVSKIGSLFRHKNQDGEILPTDSPDIVDTITDWHKARKPVQFSDVISWIYGTAFIDVSEFINSDVTLKSIVENAFINKNSMDNENIEYISPSTESENPVVNMITAYGGEYLKDLDSSLDISTSDYKLDLEPGDVVCVFDKKLSDNSAHKNDTSKVCVYCPCDNDEVPFLCVSSDAICSRQHKEWLWGQCMNSRIFFVLRPSKVSTDTQTEEPVVTTLKTINGSTVNNNKTYYFLIDSKGSGFQYSNASYTLKFDIHSNTSHTCKQDPEEVKTDVRFVIKPLLKYVWPKLTSDASESLSKEFFSDTSNDISVLSKIAKMDVKEIFDYSYVVPDADIVEYPLDSMAFLDADHPMNRFTICEYVIPDGDLSKDMIVSAKVR